MIIKNALKESQISFNDDGETQSEDSPMFIQNMLLDCKKHRTKKYGEMVKWEKLNNLLSKEMIKEQNMVIKNVMKQESRLEKVSLLSVVILGMVLFSGMMLKTSSFLKSIEDTVVNGQFVGLTLCGIMAVMGIFWCLKRNKEEERIEQNGAIKVKDQEGNAVKLIWFLYHNTPFETENEKEEFLNRYYQKYNHDLIINIKACVDAKIDVEGYLESLKHKFKLT